MSTKYRIYCTQSGDEGWQEVWSDTPPTTCPNNVSHSVNPNSIQEIGYEKEAYRISNLNIKIKTNSFSTIINTYYDTQKCGKLRRVKLVSYKDSNVTSYDVQVNNLTNAEILTTSNHTNNNSQLEDVGIISNFPEGNVFIEVNVKKNGGNVNQNITITEIIFYCE